MKFLMSLLSALCMTILPSLAHAYLLENVCPPSCDVTTPDAHIQAFSAPAPINITSSGVLTVDSPGLFDYFGYLINSGRFDNNGDTINSGQIENDTTFNNQGTIENLYLILNLAGTLNNNAGGRITIDARGNLFNSINGTINNNTGSTIDNFGDMVNTEPGNVINNIGTLNNFNALENYGTLNNAGTINERGQITGSGIYTQTGGATQVDGTFIQDTLNIQSGTFTQSGATALASSDAQSPIANAPPVETYITSNVTNGGSVTINGNDMLVNGSFTNTGSVIIDGPTSELDVLGGYNQSGSGSKTLLNGGVLDPPSINITGGEFGGVGTIIGDVTLTDTTLLVGNPSDPTGDLNIQGGLTQTGGAIVFGIASDGSGGFLSSNLMFDPGVNINIAGADIIFNFANNIDPADFGLINLNDFLQSSGSGDLASIFQGDTFLYQIGSGTYQNLSFDTSTGQLSISSVPEPGTLWLFCGGGLMWFAFRVWRKRESHVLLAPGQLFPQMTKI